ncbi:MAG: 16S rRNA (guanine(527)-N(7))-methyltransferase RsmG [Bacteroidota bacterium]|nr:16S rRNA (guanine(527)-N(7))-methyltransferase RsmG [Bacteroidota bacterium]
MKLIRKYFSNLNNNQLKKFESLFGIYSDWNSKINVISRKDLDNFYLRHVLHSMSIAKFHHFSSGTSIMDLGTGGGFPGIPLSILYPEVNFHLVDSISKKIKVVEDILKKLNLKNVEIYDDRAENIDITVNFVTCRAVAPMQTLVNWVGKKVSGVHKPDKKNGLLCLKGGDIYAELKDFNELEVVDLNTYFEESFFESKKLVYLPLN